MLSQYKVIGLMSGSSLDGLDIAYCIFEKRNDAWSYSIKVTDCVRYSQQWIEKLRSARQLDGKSLWQLHADYGHLLAESVNEFISDFNLAGRVDLIASHGHTVFHFPELHFTTQIGDGAALSTGTGIAVACDFRSSDVALGGHGAPIVPIGDMLLFSEYNYLLNLGGIANISVKQDGKIIAYDICAANQVLNYYAVLKGQEYDKDGAMAAAAKLHQPLLDALEGLDFYQKPSPKSLDNGFSSDVVIPVIERFVISLEDKLHTYCEHIAKQIAAEMAKSDAPKTGELFMTGGGALNKYLTGRIAAHSPLAVHVPSEEVVQYKEALVIAFIGLLRWLNQPNVLSPVTGASRNSIGGAVYLP